jgi:UDP-2,4-diacetamido-2,4,6-trideoxy-beta-L-altropyranose hydrolase
MRCLTLADRLKFHADVIFICQELEGNLTSYIRSRGYKVHSLPPKQESWEIDAELTIANFRTSSDPVDWLIIDHYGLDARYESVMRLHVKRVMVIDDLADRPHRCDLLLDQNPYGDANKRYEGLVEQGSALLLGPKYALLKPEFAKARKSVKRSGEVRNLLISFGGADPTGETFKTLQALELEELAKEKLRIKVLMGRINRQAEHIRDLCEKLAFTECYDHVENVAELMQESDLAIGSGGTTTWERCCLGLPTIVVITANNQIELSEQASVLGVISLLGRSEQVQPTDIQNKVLHLMGNPDEILDMSARGMHLVDGLGADRTVKELLTC